MRWTPLALAALIACDYSADTDDTDDVGSTPVCDGRQQSEESNVDAPFDKDGDGFFDASDPGCAATWMPNQLDCDDNDPNVNPAALELPCNGIDEDCRDASPDNADNDGDGVGVCEDCNDSNDDVAPGNTEICFDDLDNDCDGITDNDCGGNYNGTWIVTPNDITETCNALGTPVVNVQFQQLFVAWFPPNLSISSSTSAQPPAMDGTVASDGTFVVEETVGAAGSCIETYRIEATFTSETTMEGSFTFGFSPSIPLACLSCGGPPQTFEFTAVKQ
ncbi:MAG: putative metal-binding motif-containing protein [Myxococcota bacterium]